MIFLVVTNNLREGSMGDVAEKYCTIKSVSKGTWNRLFHDVFIRCKLMITSLENCYHCTIVTCSLGLLLVSTNI